MYIKCGETFKKFLGFDKKLADSIEIIFDNTKIKCSLDHRFKDLENKCIYAKDLKPGDKLKNERFGESTVIEIIELGKKIVYTPVEVDGTIYESDNGLLNHNCSFIGSSCTLINGNILEKLTEKEPVETLFEDLTLNIYEKPIPNALYVMGCDCASGVGGDYACVQVLKIESQHRYVQVATYRSNEVKNGAFARVIDFMSKMYNNAYFIVENNDVGETVTNEIWYTLENFNMINTERGSLGTDANKKSKLKACLELQRVMEAGILELSDSVTIAEISRFEEQAPNVFKAAKGNHDDTVTSLYWAVYATLQPEIDMENIRVIESKKVEDDMPFDIMVDTFELKDGNSDFWSDFK